MIRRIWFLTMVVAMALTATACDDGELTAPAVEEAIEAVSPPSTDVSESVDVEVPDDFTALAYVTTDKADYQPGERVHVTGAGFAPGETVTLTFEETPTIHEAHTLTTVADENGHISNAEYLIDEHDRGQAFTLTATGSESGFTTQEFFTDHHNARSVSPSITDAFSNLQLSVGGSFPPSRQCVFLTTTFFDYRIRLTRESGTGAGPVERRAQNSGSAVSARFSGRPPGIDRVSVVAVPSNLFCGPSHSRDVAGTLTWRQPNRPPIANAGPDRTVFRTSPAGATVQLQGSGSDPDGDPIFATWHRPPGNPAAFATGFTPTVTLPLGVNGLLLRVRDNRGGVGGDVVVWTVLNNSPVADAGPDQVVECTSHHGAAVTLDGSGSSDVDGVIVAYEWILGGTVVATGPNPTLTLPLGAHTITLRVRDNNGAMATDDVLVRVVDTTPPDIAMSVSPTSLRPPDHRMVKVSSGIAATDVCDPAPALSVDVTSDEAVNGEGDGNTDPDWEVVQNPDGSFDVWVRAERAGGGDGRLYTVTATATDRSGNAASRSATVEVPHDRGRRP